VAMGALIELARRRSVAAPHDLGIVRSCRIYSTRPFAAPVPWITNTRIASGPCRAARSKKRYKSTGCENDSNACGFSMPVDAGNPG